MMKKTIIVFCLFLIACEQKQEAKDDSKVSLRQDIHHAGMIWQAPEGWIQENPSNPMRKAQFSTPRETGDSEDGSVVITFFPQQGQVGGVEANLKRWYGQFKQPDGGNTEEKALIKNSKINNLDLTTVEVSGTYLFQPNMMSGETVEKPNYKMLAAIVQSSQGPYFIKFTGPEKTVTKWRESFNKFLETFKE